MRGFAIRGAEKGGGERGRGGDARSKDIRDGILNDSFAIRLSSQLSSSSSPSVCSRIRVKRRVPSCNLVPSPPSPSSFPRGCASKKHDDSVPSRNGLPNLLWNLLFEPRPLPLQRANVEWRTLAKNRHETFAIHFHVHPRLNLGSRARFSDSFRILSGVEKLEGTIGVRARTFVSNMDLRKREEGRKGS